MISFKQKGDFSKFEKYLKELKTFDIDDVLKECGEAGVRALSSATPVDTGLTADSWYYEIEKNKNMYEVTFYNSNVVDHHCNVAILLQFGHGTGTGGWVEGVDYINPALRPVFDEIVEKAWREVTNL